ncbi:MAG TPA: ATP-binding cassette domain-containing protein [Rhizomicrobium sp.]
MQISILRPSGDAETRPRFRSAGLTLARNGKTIARVPDFALAPGETAALVGPSGSGKTTALMAFALMRAPSGGEIAIDGVDPWRLPRAARDRYRGRHVGLVFQSFHLVDALSVEQNVLLAGRCAGQPLDAGRAAALLARLGLSAVRHHRADRISHGQAQRVAVARALYNRPSVILADEPTSALDDANADAMLELLTDTAAEQGAALLVTSHDRRVLDRMDHTLALAEIAA